jgi:arginyl-tRNA synthetase
VALDIKLMQLVKLWKNGAPFKMSKRAGTFVTLRDVVEQVGPDVTRFVMLTRRNDVALDFDFDKVLEQSKDNPVFYVQYAHARLRSAMRKAAAAGIDCRDGALSAADLSQLGHPAELALMRRLAEWPRQVDQAARTNEPHRIVFYLSDLAADFHALWNRGTEDSALKLVQEDAPEASRAKIALARATGVVISAGLAIVGVSPVEEMR